MTSDNRVALVTGAARGQGAAIVKRLRQDGFLVAACDLLADELKAGIEELDFKGSVSYGALLPNELIHSRLPDLPGSVPDCVDSVIFARRGTVQPHLEANGLTALCRTQDHVQIAAVKAHHSLAGCCLNHRTLGTDAPRSAQSPLIQRRSRGWAICLWRAMSQSLG